MQDWNISDAAATLHRDALVWDNVFPLEPSMNNDLGQLARFAASGFNVVSLTIAGDNHNISQAVQRVAEIRRRVKQDAVNLVFVETVNDIETAKQAGKLAVTLHFEGTRCLERNVDMVQIFYDLGVRHNLLAFNQSNSTGSGCAERCDGGLTRFGSRLIAEMERVGMLLDLSHTGYRTTMDALEQATRPVLFTHSNATAIAPHYRNLRDDQIKACAETGGLVGISGSSDYLGDPQCRNETIFRHIDYIVDLVGPEHVGLGLDVVFGKDKLNAFIRSRPDEWPGATESGWPGFSYAKPGQIPALTEMMLERGYSKAVIRAVLGENYLRIAKQAWR